VRSCLDTEEGTDLVFSRNSRDSLCSQMAPDPNSRHEVVHGPLQAFFRTTQFWRRATGIYLSYKGAQAKAQALRLRGWNTEKLKEVHWKPHHAWAGEEMYSLCVDMRGFYLKVCLSNSRLLSRKQATHVMNAVKLLLSWLSCCLKVGQFLGARGDFMPLPVCERLSRLHDQVVTHCSLSPPTFGLFSHQCE
jgi:hypothetical protein